VFTGVSGSINPKVRDSRGIIVSAPQINCNVAVKFVLLSVDGAGTGYITNSTGSNISSSFDVTQSYGSTYPVTASATSGSNFLGWTYNKDGVEVNPFITTGSNYSHSFINNNEIIYAAVKKNNTTTYKFCYYTGSSVTSSLCTSCATTSSVYFALSQLSGSGFISSSWYVSSSLTGSTPNGYYKLIPFSGSAIDNKIYSLTNGTASLFGTCNSGSIYCV
jgi:hypothetical protein